MEQDLETASGPSMLPRLKYLDYQKRKEGKERGRDLRCLFIFSTLTGHQAQVNTLINDIIPAQLLACRAIFMQRERVSVEEKGTEEDHGTRSCESARPSRGRRATVLAIFSAPGNSRAIISPSTANEAPRFSDASHEWQRTRTNERTSTRENRRLSTTVWLSPRSRVRGAYHHQWFVRERAARDR